MSSDTTRTLDTYGTTPDEPTADAYDITTSEAEKHNAHHLIDHLLRIESDKEFRDEAMNERRNLRDAVDNATDPKRLRDIADRLSAYHEWAFGGDTPDFLQDVANEMYDLKRTASGRAGHLEFPFPGEWPVPQHEVERVRDLPSLRPSTRSEFTWDGWVETWDRYDADDLRFIYRAIDEFYKYDTEEGFVRRMLQGMRHFKTDGDVIVSKACPIPKTNQARAGKRVTREHVSNTMNRLHPVLASAALAYLREIKREKPKKSRGGYFDRYQRQIRVGAVGKWEKKNQQAIVPHELGHALFHMLGIYADGGDGTDNRDVPRDDWVVDWVDCPNGAVSGYTSMYEEVRVAFERFRQGAFESVREYQERNGDEFLACAFEHWVLDPEDLRETQPAIADVFDRWLTAVPRDPSPDADDGREQAELEAFA